MTSGTGAVGRRREFLRLDGSPDGMCADEQGNLWIAIWGAGQVRCYSPAGEQRAVVDVPAPNTTSVAFVGPTLETLLITTASEQLSATQLARYPNSGRLFIAHVERDAGCPFRRGQAHTRGRLRWSRRSARRADESVRRHGTPPGRDR